MSWRAYDLMMAQEPLDVAATKIQALAARPGPARAGFFDTAVDASRHLLTVYWHGPVPANVQRLINRLRARVGIRVVQARYGLAILNRDALAAIRSYAVVADGYPVSDGSGLVVGVRSGAHRAAAIAAALRARFGVPVVATLAGQDQPQYCVFNKEDTLSPPTRCDDHPSFWGGNVIQHTDELGTYGCSGGFGVHGSSGQPYLLTAMHCADSIFGYTNGLTFYNGQDPGHWTRIGQITDVGGTVDAAIIPAPAGNRYYDGPGIYSGDTRDNKIVSGQLAVSVGDNYCESGAFGGVKCGFIVLQTNVSLRDPVVLGHVWTDLVTATSSTGQFPIEGDSGGPWFSLNGCCYVWARGITWGVLFDTGKKYALFTPLTAASAKTGVTVNGS